MKKAEAPAAGIGTILFVEVRGDLYSGDPGFLDTVREMAAGRFEVDPNTWTDAYMRSFEGKYRLVLLDCGRLGEYELDVIGKLKRELDIPMILHSTEDRAPVIKSACDLGVSEVYRKPYSIARLVERIIAECDAGGAPPPPPDTEAAAD